MLGSLQRLIDDVSCSANALVGRRVAAANGAADRQVTRSDRFQTLLVDTLKGDGAQISWTDEALRQHALGGVNRLFGDDPHWCVQVTLAIRLLDPQSITGVDEILDMHVESRSGAFAPERFAGKGWNPARAIHFNGDSHRFRRAYVAHARDDWATVETPLNPVGTDIGASSGFEVSGRRGCATRLFLRQSVELAAAQTFGDTFRQRSRRLTTSALRGLAPVALSDAIRAAQSFEETYGHVHVQFRAVTVVQDPREPSVRLFQLSFDHA